MPKAKKAAEESVEITDVIVLERIKAEGKVRVALMSGKKKIGEELRAE